MLPLPELHADNAYASFTGLLALAKPVTCVVVDDEPRGACKMCGRVGHLTYQCKNFFSPKDQGGDKDGIQPALSLQACGERVEMNGSQEEEDSESSDSEAYDSEMERAIMKKMGNKAVTEKKHRRRSHKHSDTDCSDDDSVELRHKRRCRKALSESDFSGSDDSRVGAKDNRRLEKKKIRKE